MSEFLNQNNDVCPFINVKDDRCGSHFSLTQVASAFSDCFGDYQACSNYYRLSHRHPQHLVKVTVHGNQARPISA